MSLVAKGERQVDYSCLNTAEAPRCAMTTN
jgi:hypothetical protein